MTERPSLYVVSPTSEPAALERDMRLVDAAFDQAHAGDRRLLRDLLLAGADPGVLWAAIQGNKP